jgi:hypothetical protein
VLRGDVRGGGANKMSSNPALIIARVTKTDMVQNAFMNSYVETMRLQDLAHRQVVAIVDVEEKPILSSNSRLRGKDRNSMAPHLLRSGEVHGGR